MRPTPSPVPVRRLVAPLAVVALALASMAGCECETRSPVAPIPIPPLSAVIVTPPSDTLRFGERHQFTAVALDTLGQPAGGVPFSWASDDPAVANVDAAGRVTGLGEGLTRIIVSAGGRADTATVFVFPDTAWYAQVSGSSRNLLGVFFRPDGRSGWAVGTGGEIRHTTDAGVTWTSQGSSVSANLNAVWFNSDTDGWIAGNTGTLLHTVNGGTVWTRVTVNASENLMDVTFANPTLGWAVGGSGVMLRTTNGGIGWDRQTLTGNTLRGVAAFGLDLWVVSDAGEIFGSHSGADTVFRVQPAITAQSLKSVWRRSATLAWAVGAGGVTPRTVVTPDSVAWELRNAGASFQLAGVSYPSDVVGYAVGFNGAGTILRTDDAGLTWQFQPSHTSRPLNDVFFVDPLRGWAVGDGGVIVHTARGGLR